MSKKRPHRLIFESLETRIVFAIELDLVALHEFGHSLGLAHYANTGADSIMEAYYNAAYNKANLATDVAVVPNAGDGYNNLLELFTAGKVTNNTTSWKDNQESLSTRGNGKVDITYSFVPDGTTLDNKKKSNLFATMQSKISQNNDTWQALFAEELNRWASVSNGLLSFTKVTDNGAKSGTGAIQNDPGFGDIRIGGHRFDGRGGVLAHAYYPPGDNNNSFAGDAHFASEEDWSNGDPLTNAGRLVGRFAELIHTEEGDFFKCTYDEKDDQDHAAELAANSIFQGPMAGFLDSLAAPPVVVDTDSGAPDTRTLEEQPIFVADRKSVASISTIQIETGNTKFDATLDVNPNSRILASSSKRVVSSPKRLDAEREASLDGAFVDQVFAENL